MTYLTESRDALAKALHDHRLTTPVQCACGWRETDVESGPHDAHVADALIASGAVIPAATLADDEALIERLARAINAADDEALTRTNFEHLSATYDEQAGAVLRALAAALTERSQ